MQIGIEDLKPCAGCGGPLTGKDERCPIFRVLRLAPAGLKADAINRHLGLSQFFGGGNAGHALASVMGTSEAAAEAPPEEDWTELFICNDCFCSEKFAGLHEAIERENDRLEAVAAKKAGGD